MKIDKVIKNAGNEEFKLRPIHCLDIANIIGENVVSGGVRRSSGIALISPDDKECIEAKSQLYKQINGKWEIDKNLTI
jgi:ribonucleoside-diphosphate reductase alpha chain/ribonucleoside-triphosphate reductase